eukprot:gene14017-biopygen1889
MAAAMAAAAAAGRRGRSGCQSGYNERSEEENGEKSGKGCSEESGKTYSEKSDKEYSEESGQLARPECIKPKSQLFITPRINRTHLTINLPDAIKDRFWPLRRADLGSGLSIIITSGPTKAAILFWGLT